MRQLIGCAAILAMACGTSALAAPKHHKPAATPAPVAAKPSPQPVYYDFKGAKLGMAMEQWRKLPIPGRVGEIDFPLCSIDPQYPTINRYIQDQDEKSIGVVDCNYRFDDKPKNVPDSMTHDWSWEYAMVGIGQYGTNDVTYSYLDNALFRIHIVGVSELLPDLLAGLTAKFGPPTSVVNDTIQNKAGATFPHTLQIWANPVAMIRVEAPYTETNNFGVNYVALEPEARVSAAKKAAHPDADKM